MDLNQIRELLQIVADSGVAEVEIEEEDFKLVVRKNAASVTVQPSMPFPAFGYPPPYAAPLPAAAPPALAPPAPQAAPAASAPDGAAEEAANKKPAANEIVVHAPIVGTFYRAPAPDAATFVEVGDQVKPGDVLCIIEAMKLMNEIECEVAGTLKKILVENAEAVEYDQPLFIIEKA